MRKSFRKFSAIAAGLALSLTLTAPAYAATLGSDATGANTGVATGDNSITISKTVVISNEEANDDLEVAYPAMEFAYNVTAADVSGRPTVSDGTVTAEVKAGVVDALEVSNEGKVKIDAGKVNLNAKGQEAVNGGLTIEVKPNVFTAAGIYRYKISDATAVEPLNDNGVVRGENLTKDYYLDVYITNDEVSGGYKVGGFVLSKSNKSLVKNDADKQSGFDEVITTEDGKLDPTKTADLTANDYYQTYNVTVSKVVTGVMGDKKNAFPFTVSVTNNGLGYEYDKTGNENTDLNAALLAEPQTDESFTTGLSNGGTIKVWGLSPLATVNYSENNNTKSTYKVSVENAAGEKLFTNVDFAVNGDQAAYTNPTKVAKELAAAKHEQAADVTFTNTLNQISPTGVVLRFAPFVAMMAAGMVLLLGFKSNKAYEEE